LPAWVALLEPVGPKLLPALAAEFRQPFPARATEEERAELRQRRRLAATVLAQYAAERADLLTDVLADADPRQFEVVFPKLARHGVSAIRRLEAELARQPAGDATVEALDHLAQRQANAAVALLRLPGAPAEKVWPLFQHRRDPSARSWLIHRLQPL